MMLGASASTLELYHHGTSVCAQKVRLALAEKGLNWHGFLLNLKNGDQKTAEYLKLNPKGVVPTLLHDGRVIRESTIINEYIDEVFPDPPLTPANAHGRAEMRLWTKRIDDEIHPACGALSYATTLRQDFLDMTPEQRETRLQSIEDQEWRVSLLEILENGLDAPVVDRAVKAHDKALSDMEVALTDTPWLAGRIFSLADIAFTPYLVRLDMLGMQAFWEASRHRVTDWFQRIRERPSYDTAIVPFASRGYIERYAETGRIAWPKVKAKLAAI